ncbi:MAG: type II glyceraldehyde-3-phosphate dehydrogenase [Candidatus Doudnabacteria bacterium]|jgi:glyceraldehyde-3-phosphate dehydrogenase (NAD(P))
MIKKIKVGVNGFGVIGKRVADAVTLQDDMELVGVSDVVTDWRIKMAAHKGYSVYSSNPEAKEQMTKAGLEIMGTLEDLLKKVDVIVDATPKGIGAKNKLLYDQQKVKSIFQGGEKHELTGFSFVAQANYKEALGRDFVRCVSCNTTGLTRIVHALHQNGLVKKVRAVLFRRGTDPWESHKNGLINTVVPEKDIPSHQGPDVKTILPDLEITTIAASGPFNLSHLHTIFVELNRIVTKEEIVAIYRQTPRVVMIKKSEGLEGLNSTIELMRDLERPRNDMWEVALWEDILAVDGKELMMVYQVHNESIVIPENIDAIRAITSLETDARASIAKTDHSLGIVSNFL